MIVFHNDKISPNCLKTRILLNELGIEASQVEHDFRRGELMTPEFTGKFPNAKVPALEDGDIRIAEPGAIALHLAYSHNKLIPKDPKRRALMFQALFLEGALLSPTIGGQGIVGEMSKPAEEQDRARLQSLGAEARRVGEVLDVALRGAGDYFAGEFSLADIQLFPVIFKAIRYDMMGSEALVAWSARIAARPSVRVAMQGYPGYASES